VPIDLNPKCRARITELIAAALGKIKVQHGKFVTRNSEGQVPLILANEALPQRGPIHDKLVAYIDEYPLVEFVYDTLADELRDAEFMQGEEPQGLVTVPGYQDPAAVAARLVEEFVALPREYKLTFQLPHDVREALPPEKDRHDLSVRMRLIRSSAELAIELPLIAANEDAEQRLKGGSLLSLIGSPPLQWTEGAVHLQLDASGFVGMYGGSMPDLEARRVLRSFCGLGLALRMFDTNNRYSPYPPRHHYFVHRLELDGSTWCVRDRLELDDSLSRGIERLKMHSVNGWIDSPEKQASWPARILNEMANVFSAGQKSDAILLASQWYFDSVTGPDQLLQYVQAMVTLEILLGDKASPKEIGLNELLRNRCAYLIGSSQEERTEIHKLFGEIYDVRSQIVHRGKHRLDMNERLLLGRLRLMCRRVIQKEVDLLIADKKEERAS